MALLTAANLRKDIAGAPLFDGVSFKVERRDRLALSGANGAGKTTLLRALAGEITLDGGELGLQRGLRVALHDQRPPALSDRPLGEYVLTGTADLAGLELELRELEQRMADGAHDERTMASYARAQAALEHAGGYDWRERASAVARNLGFSDADLARPLNTFSGGELTRASLARALAAQPDLLFLDEPTNHLDIETIEWLEELLRTLDAGVILVAHDRWFLEAVTTAVLELERGKSVYFPGKWHVWRLEQAAGPVRGQDAARDAEQIAPARALRRALRREGHEGRASAQSKRKQIDRLESESGRDQARPPALGSSSSPPSARAASCSRPRIYGSPPASATCSRRLVRPRTRRARLARRAERLGQDDAARNADGSWSTLKAGGASSATASNLHTSPSMRRSSTSAGLSSTPPWQRPDSARRRAEAARALPVLRLGTAREACQRAFGGRAAAPHARDGRRLWRQSARPRRTDQPPRPGEREALEAALDAFPGTVLLVTHDRALLDAVSGRLLSLENGRLVSYPGGWADFRRNEPTPTPPTAAKPRPAKERPARERPPRAPAEDPLALLEKEITLTEQRVAELELQLAEDWTNRDLVVAHGAARSGLASLLSRWEQLFEQVQA